MSFVSDRLRSLRAGVRSGLRSSLSQQRRTELKRLQVQMRKKMAPLLSLVHGKFTTGDLMKELSQRLPADFEILMVHSSFDGLLPMYQGSAKDLVAALIEFCGPNRTLVMPAFVMGGRDYDTVAYFRNQPFDVRRTPSETGLVGEVFRRTPNVWRSLHPTCSVCALGPLAKEMTADHHLAESGMAPDSPFGVMTRRRTAIVGLGIEYYRSLTHVHTAGAQIGEEKFPIKFVKATTPVTLVDYEGVKHEYQLGLPDRTKKLDLRVLWSVLSREELVEWRYHGVSMYMVPNAGLLTARLVEAAMQEGITVYGNVPVGQRQGTVA